MPRWLAWTLGALFVLALGLHAHQPLLGEGGGIGFSQSDLRALLGVSDCLDQGRLRAQAGCYFDAQQSGARPLAALSLATSTALWSDGGSLGGARALPLRVENLLMLLLAAIGAGLFLRRLALPWLGDEHARAAAWVSIVFCLLHPLAFAGIVSIAARGDLIALALGTWAGAVFLRGRQTRDARAPFKAGGLVLAAGFASGLAGALPIVLAAAEFLAGRRFRSWSARSRSSLTMLAVFAACAGAEPLLRRALGAPLASSAATHSGLEELALALERLGVLALPINSESLSFAAYLLAAALLVAALEPAFSAARSAPRLWSLILALGAAAMLAASFVGLGVRVSPGDFTQAESLLPGVFVASAGAALASTSLGGLRRSLMPAILATGWAMLANGHAASWAASIERFALVRSEIEQAMRSDERPQAVCLLDVPVSIEGFAALQPGMAHDYLSAPEVLAENAGELEQLRKLAQPRVKVRTATRGAWTQFVRTTRFSQWREAGLVLVLDVEGARVHLRLPKASPSTGSRRWFRDGVSTVLDWESLSLRVVSAQGARETDIARAPFLSWSASGIDGHFTSGEIRGVWIDEGGEPRAYFDVGDSVEWLCSGRVQLASPVQGWSNLSEADARDESQAFDPPPLPQARSRDWRVPVLASSLADAAQTTLARSGESGVWSLSLCNLETLEQARFELEHSPADDPQAWRARGAGRVAAAWAARGHELAWSLAYSARGVVLVRAEGSVLPGGAQAR